MVENSAAKWFWSLKWASGDEKWGLKNVNFHKKSKNGHEIGQIWSKNRIDRRNLRNFLR